MAKRQPKEKQPETYEEWVAWEKAQWHTHHEDDVLIGKPTYLYKVGEEVFIGNLKDCRVEEILDDGMRYLVSYHDLAQKYGSAFDLGRKPHIAWWKDMIPKSLVEDTAFARPRTHADYRQTSLDSLLLTGYRRGYIDNPDYQRDYVWTLEDKQRLIRSVFNRTDIGKFLFVEYDWPENRIEIVDGKQRLLAIREFMEGRFAYEGKNWYQLSHHDRRAFDEAFVHTCTLNGSQVSKADILWLFLSVNEAGVPQTEEHIARAKKMYEEELAKEKS